MVSVVLTLLMTVAASVPVRTIAKGEMSAVDDARQVVVRTQAEWEALWRQHNWTDPAPTVDFSRETIVGVFLGTRPTAGYSVEITKAAVDDDTLLVTYVERRPPPGAVTAQILTMPYHLAAVPAQRAAVRFVRLEGAGD